MPTWISRGLARLALVEALAAPPLVIEVALPTGLASVDLPGRCQVGVGGGAVLSRVSTLVGPPGDRPARQSPASRAASGSLGGHTGAALSRGKGPAHTPGQRAGAGALGPKEVGPVARALPALQRCILGGWVWSSLCLKRFPHLGCWWSCSLCKSWWQAGRVL